MLEQRRFAIMSLAAHAATGLFLFIYLCAWIITVADSAVFYTALPYRHFVLAASLVLLVLVPGRSWRLKMGLFLIMVVWFSVLPRVSWHEEAHFFINAGTIRKGMTEERVRAKLRTFLSTTSPDGRRLEFQPSPDSSNRCVVTLRDGRVRDVQLRRTEG